MVAARSRHHAGRRYLAGQEIGKSATGLEAAEVLKKLKLER
jgi:hypothetical protein